MSAVGIDTNILLRIANPDDLRYDQTVRTVARLHVEGARLFLVPQALTEFWVVATRPVEVNGLGASARAADAEIARLLGFFELVPGPAGTFETWRRIVSGVPVVGRRAHDASLAASYATAGCDRLLTFNLVCPLWVVQGDRHEPPATRATRASRQMARIGAILIRTQPNWVRNATILIRMRPARVRIGPAWVLAEAFLVRIVAFRVRIGGKRTTIPRNVE